MHIFNIFIQNIIQAFCAFYLYILFMTGLPLYYGTLCSNHEISTISMLCTLKKNSHFTPLRPHDGHLSTTATFSFPYKVAVVEIEVWLHSFRELLSHTKMLKDNNIILLIFTYPS